MATFSIPCMKKHTSLSQIVVTLSVLIIATISMAVPVGVGNEGIDYLIKDKDLSWLGAGVYYGKVEREVDLDTNPSADTILDVDRAYVYVSVSPVNFLSIYVLGGSSDGNVDVKNGNAQTSSNGDFGLGFRLNLLDHFIKEPVPFEDRFRMNFGVEHVFSETEWNGKTVDWQKTDAAITFGVVNDTVGNKFFTCESIALYIGGIFSILTSDDFEESKSVGGMGGIEFFITDSFSLDAKAYIFEEASYDIGLNVRF